MTETCPQNWICLELIVIECQGLTIYRQYFHLQIAVIESKEHTNISQTNLVQHFEILHSPIQIFQTSIMFSKGVHKALNDQNVNF